MYVIPKGTAIKLQLSGVETPRPLTFNLVANLLQAAGAQVEAVHVNELRDDTLVYQPALASAGHLKYAYERGEMWRREETTGIDAHQRVRLPPTT